MIKAIASSRVNFLNNFYCLPLYQTHNISSEKGHSFDCELGNCLEQLFTFSSLIINGSLCPLLCFQTVVSSLFQVPTACLGIFLMTLQLMCALTEVPSIASPSPSVFCQSGTLTCFAVLEAGIISRFLHA